MRNKDTEKAEQMKCHIETCRSSGMSVTEYCKANGLSKSDYYYWHKKLQPQKTSGSFLQVTMRGSKTGLDNTITIHYPNGVSLEINSAVNISTLKELVCCI